MRWSTKTKTNLPLRWLNACKVASSMMFEYEEPRGNDPGFFICPIDRESLSAEFMALAIDDLIAAIVPLTIATIFSAISTVLFVMPAIMFA